VSPLLAQSGHQAVARQCPLLGVKRTLTGRALECALAGEPSVIGKWMEMLKQIAPQTAHAALLGNPKTAVYYDYLLQAAEAAAPSLGVEPFATRIGSDVADIERAITAIAGRAKQQHGRSAGQHDKR
jgi:hypothetical protein